MSLYAHLKGLLGFGTAPSDLPLVIRPEAIEQPLPSHVLVLSVDAPAVLLVRDAAGNLSGILPYPGSSRFYLAENVPESAVETSAMERFVIVPADGEYQVVIAGIDEGDFTYRVREYEDSELVSDSSVTGIPATSRTRAYGTASPGEPAPLLLDENGDGTADRKIALRKNEAQEYPYASAAYVGEDELWPNPYLLPPPPFGLPEKEAFAVEQVEAQAPEEEAPDVPQTASVFNAVGASISWLLEAVASLLAVILRTFGLA